MTEIGSNQTNRKTECPPTADLHDWLTGRRQLTSEVLQHIDHCDACQAFLRESSDDASLRQWRGNLETANRLEPDAFTREPEFQLLQSSLQKVLQRVDAGEPGDNRPSTIRNLRDQELLDTERPDGNVADLSWVHDRIPGNRYKIERLIERGGNAAVYRAYDGQLRRTVAVKVMVCGSQRNQHRMRREARFMADIQHSNVVPVHDVGELTSEDPSRSEGLFLVME
ncbi:MAG: hypothetical protein AAFP90_21525, partial [Planctomycetota bacterium]